jgi:hypothetical protein
MTLAYEKQQGSTSTTLELAALRDMGTHDSPPTRAPDVPVMWTRPVRSPTDLQVDPETLFATPTTLEDSRRPYIDPRGPSPRSRLDTASMSADRVILPVITKDDLPNL